MSTDSCILFITNTLLVSNPYNVSFIIENNMIVVGRAFWLLIQPFHDAITTPLIHVQIDEKSALDMIIILLIQTFSSPC